jgi:hypothetical protein
MIVDQEPGVPEWVIRKKSMDTLLRIEFQKIFGFIFIQYSKQ